VRKRSIVIQALSLSLAVLSATLPPSMAKPSESGADLVDRHGCKSCHVIEGSGSFVAPPLGGTFKTKDEIVVKLSQSKPQKRLPYALPLELMSHVRVSKGDAKLIADYLTTLPVDNLAISGHGDAVVVPPQSPAGSRFAPQAKSASSERGLKLFKDKGCIACHAVGSLGGTVGPNLGGIGARRSRNYIASRISTGAVFLPKPGQASAGFTMPPAKLTPDEIEDLTNWLMTLPIKQ
jgi:mono/diheme cytochrome c family protein